MDAYELFRELSNDLAFGTAQHALLARAKPLMAARVDHVVDRFYVVLGDNPIQRAIFEDQEQIDRQKLHLRDWLLTVFDGVYDAAYVARRVRIGHVHVRIRLPQRYMVSMMSVLRRELQHVVSIEAPAAGWGPEAVADLRDALDSILDLELALMLDTYREDHESRMRSKERLASLGQLAASIGHELRNPLAVIDSSTHLIARRTNDERVSKHVDRIREQVARSNHIITDLLELARDRPPRRQEIQARQLVEGGLSELARDGVTLELVVAREGSVNVDEPQLQQVVFNLVQNALQAASSRVRVEVSAEDGMLRLEVVDDGSGFTREVKANLFEPLFTTKAKGIGLGLWLCRRIVENHGGSLVASEVPGGGARFDVLIPPSPRGHARD